MDLEKVLKSLVHNRITKQDFADLLTYIHFIITKFQLFDYPKKFPSSDKLSNNKDVQKEIIAKVGEFMGDLKKKSFLSRSINDSYLKILFMRQIILFFSKREREAIAPEKYRVAHDNIGDIVSIVVDPLSEQERQWVLKYYFNEEYLSKGKFGFKDMELDEKVHETLDKFRDIVIDVYRSSSLEDGATFIEHMHKYMLNLSKK